MYVLNFWARLRQSINPKCLLAFSFFLPTSQRFISIFSCFFFLHRDMDDWSLALLSCKITLRGCNTDAVVKRKGDPSNYAYIVLGGSCKVIYILPLKSFLGCCVVCWLGTWADLLVPLIMRMQSAKHNYKLTSRMDV